MEENTTKACIVMFVKYPEKGTVKTRLALSLDSDIVLQLYKYFITDLLKMISSVGVPTFIFYTPATKEPELRSWLGPNYRYVPQAGDSLGERMKSAFAHCFRDHFEKVIIIGSDSPDLPAALLDGAFTQLAMSDVVIGPTQDGGYYLIGFQRDGFCPEIFDDMQWGTNVVFDRTMQKLKVASKVIFRLPEWCDIDVIDDVGALRERNLHSDFRYSQTMAFLLRHKTILSK